MNVINIEVDELAEYIFKTNQCNQIYINVRCLKSTKELFFFLFDIFCKGIVLLYGKNKKTLLNNLQLYQFEEIKEKLRYAHIKLNLEIYNKDTAILLDMMKEANNEKMIIQQSIDDIINMNDNEDLSKYVFKIFMNESLFCIHFEIIR